MSLSEQEQLIHDIEARQIALRKELDAVTAERDLYHNKTTTLQSRLDELTDKLEAEKRANADKDALLKQKEATIKEYELSHEDWQDRLRRRSEECDRLRDDIKSQADEIEAISGRLRASQIALTEAHELLLPVQYDLDKQLREKASLEARLKILEADVQSKIVELSESRQKHAAVTMDLENRLALAEGEGNQAREKLKSCEVRNICLECSPRIINHHNYVAF